MTVIRRRRPRVEFAQIPNAILRDYRLSWRARGLLAELLSYPADYLISVDELVKRARRVSGATEGRDAMRAAVRELKAVGYIVSTKRQDARGRWVTEVEVTDDPAYDMPNPPLADVSAGHTDDGIPGVGEPGVGEPGDITNTEENTDTNTSSSSSSSNTRASEVAVSTKEEEEEQQAERLVNSALQLWNSAHARPTGTTRRTLTTRVARELADGATPDAVVAELVRDLQPHQVRNAVAVVMARTRVPGWAQCGDVSAQPMGNAKPAWCGTCNERTRHRTVISDDGRERTRRCPRCHPLAVAEVAERAASDVAEVAESAVSGIAEAATNVAEVATNSSATNVAEVAETTESAVSVAETTETTEVAESVNVAEVAERTPHTPPPAVVIADVRNVLAAIQRQQRSKRAPRYRTQRAEMRSDARTAGKQG